MKYFIRFFLVGIALSFIAYTAKAQFSLEFVSKQDTVNSETGVDLATSHIEIRNVTSGNVDVIMKVEKVEVTEGHEVLFCDPNLCLYLGDQQVKESTSPFTLGFMESTGDACHVDVEPWGYDGVTLVRVTYYLEDAPTDRIDYYAYFNFSAVSVNESEEAAIVSNPAPNPASDMVKMDVNFDYAGQVYMKIIDSNGNLVDSQKISGTSSNINLDVSGFISGRYFINFYAGGKKIDTKMLSVVR